MPQQTDAECEDDLFTEFMSKPITAESFKVALRSYAAFKLGKLLIEMGALPDDLATRVLMRRGS